MLTIINYFSSSVSFQSMAKNKWLSWSYFETRIGSFVIANISHNNQYEGRGQKLSYFLLRERILLCKKYLRRKQNMMKISVLLSSAIVQRTLVQELKKVSQRNCSQRIISILTPVNTLSPCVWYSISYLSVTSALISSPQDMFAIERYCRSAKGYH